MVHALGSLGLRLAGSMEASRRFPTASGPGADGLATDHPGRDHSCGEAGEARPERRGGPECAVTSSGTWNRAGFSEMAILTQEFILRAGRAPQTVPMITW